MASFKYKYKYKYNDEDEVMRTIIDLPEDHVKALDLIGKKQDVSRTELVRRAVDMYLAAEQKTTKTKLDQYFGIFKDDPTVFDGLDGLAWQKKMREEWAGRDADIDRRLAENNSLNDQKQADYKT
jgi:hypothetical protein